MTIHGYYNWQLIQGMQQLQAYKIIKKAILTGIGGLNGKLWLGF